MACAGTRSAICSADHRAEGFSSVGAGNRAVWLPEPLWTPPIYSREEKQLAQDAMHKMQIGSLAKRCYRELSGGQQQRVLLARALCATRKMLLLDEPVSGLDPKATTEMYHLIEKLNQQEGITVLMISHDIQAAVCYASHILHVGETIFFGTREAYLQSPQGRLFAAGKGGAK